MKHLLAITLFFLLIAAGCLHRFTRWANEALDKRLGRQW